MEMSTKRFRLELRYPNSNCSYPGRYHYYVELFDPRTGERCPICGYYADLRDFCVNGSAEILDERRLTDARP